ncbi:hypothetical protein F511_25510 [Dorcoceras hygrometricum]|uniref:Uncharacterized protein n=1 Tax=Dorcoceras hygrometricum TaxID=472368 RepID=A0A2Z7C4Q0_9LAMI|nr:hypothetical protein F511_25510 [Dorcoceras hygrometricum]
MTFRVVRTNQYNQDLGLIHSTNGNHLESPNEGSSIDHQVTIHLHAQNITMFPTNETCSALAHPRVALLREYVSPTSLAFEAQFRTGTSSRSSSTEGIYLGYGSAILKANLVAREHQAGSSAGCWSSTKTSTDSEEQFKSRIKRRIEEQNAQVQNSSSADQVQCTRAVIECEYMYKRSDREQIKNQLVKDKPAGQNLQEQTVKEDLSSEDDEDQLERRSADKRKLEELLKSGCKREEKKRYLNCVKEQPARTKTSSKQIKLMNRLASWLKSNQLR